MGSRIVRTCDMCHKEVLDPKDLGWVDDITQVHTIYKNSCSYVVTLRPEFGFDEDDLSIAEVCAACKLDIEVQLWG